MISLKLIIFIFVCYGISNSVVYSDGPINMFLKIRNLANKIGPNFGELFNCMMCFPFWAGAIISLLDIVLFTSVLFTPFNLVLGFESTIIIKAFIIVLDGFLSSGTTWLIHNIEEFFERYGK